MAEVTLPSLGESVTEGIITQWFKKVGDAVSRDEALFEVSTDKVDSEMPSPFSGVITKILAEEGDTVQTGAAVCVIDENATGGNTAGAQAPSSTDAAPATAPKAAPAAAVASEGSASGVVVSPVVRRILADGLVEPSTVKGTGPGGAITRRDAERAVANGPTEDVPVVLSNGRRRMGQHMSVSSISTPHGFVAVEVDGAVFAKLDRLGRTTSEGAEITDEMLVSLAAVRAIGEFEFLNATYVDDQFTLHRTVNLGLVRQVSDDGMLVPVVHAAAGLTLRAFAARVRDLESRISARQLTADDLMGGTFTIMGATSKNTLYSEAIIIQPQVAVLSIGAVREVPVIEDGAVVLGRRVVLGLSFDHRVCEPFVAAAYLERVGELLAGLDLEGER